MSYSEVVDKLRHCEDIIAIALGGSRSKGLYKSDSDYDLFCVIRDEKFEYFRKEFRIFLEEVPSVLFAAEAFYLENWGYLFKAVDLDNINYDISIISKSRISEISIRSTNVIIKDTEGVYQSYVSIADDSRFLVSKLESEHFYDYGTLFGFEKKRFNEAIRKKDYWYAVRCLERMKNYLIRCDRIQNKVFAKTCSCPEKEYIDINDCIKKIYIIDGTIDTLIQTSEELGKLLCLMIRDKEIHTRSQLLC